MAFVQPRKAGSPRSFSPTVRAAAAGREVAPSGRLISQSAPGRSGAMNLSRYILISSLFGEYM